MFVLRFIFKSNNLVLPRVLRNPTLTWILVSWIMRKNLKNIRSFTCLKMQPWAGAERTEHLLVVWTFGEEQSMWLKGLGPHAQGYQIYDPQAGSNLQSCCVAYRTGRRARNLGWGKWVLGWWWNSGHEAPSSLLHPLYYNPSVDLVFCITRGPWPYKYQQKLQSWFVSVWFLSLNV